MTSSITFLKNLSAKSKNPQIKVRVIHVWKQPPNGQNKEETMEFLLLDEQGDRIQATIRIGLYDSVAKLLVYQSTVMIKNIFVTDNKANYPLLNLKYKVVFYNSTSITTISTFNGPLYGFNFLLYSDVLCHKLKDKDTIDVIGRVLTVGEVKPFISKGVQKKLIPFCLVDLEGTQLKCTLFDTFVDDFLEKLSKDDTSVHNIMVLQGAKIKDYQGELSIQNAFYGTKMFLNDKIDDIVNFSNSLKSNGVTDTTVEKLPSASNKSTSADNFLKDDVKHINLPDITDHKEVAIYNIIGTIENIHTKGGYWYRSCKNCRKGVYKMTEDDIDTVDVNKFTEGLRCQMCFPKPPVLYPSYKVNINVMNDSGSVTLTLFDNIITKLIHISCHDLRKKYIDAPLDLIPEELYQIVGLKMLFQISVSPFNIINNYKKYTVSDCTDDEKIVKKWQKQIGLDMVTDSDDVVITESEKGPSHGHISLKSASTIGKRKLDLQDDELIFVKSSYNKSKKTPLEVKLEKD